MPLGCHTLRPLVCGVAERRVRNPDDPGRWDAAVREKVLEGGRATAGPPRHERVPEGIGRSVEPRQDQRVAPHPCQRDDGCIRPVGLARRVAGFELRPYRDLVMIRPWRAALDGSVQKSTLQAAARAPRGLKPFPRARGDETSCRTGGQTVCFQAAPTLNMSEP